MSGGHAAKAGAHARHKKHAAHEEEHYPTTDPRAAALNRRVEIIVQSTLPAETRALLPSATTNHSN